MWKSCPRSLVIAPGEAICKVLCLLLWLAAPAVLTATAAAANADADGDANASADLRSGVYGLWESAKGTVFSISEKDGLLQAQVVAMRKPRLDKNNPVAELRSRPVLGIQVLSDYQFKRGAWRGRIYDPGSGSNFKSYIKRDDQGNLRLRGYVGFALFGKTEIFEPVDGCSERLAGVLDPAWRDNSC